MTGHGRLALVTTPRDEPPVLAYALHSLTGGRHGLRRTRWELYDGARLVAAGWHTRGELAHRALRTAASRHAHELAGVRALRPWRTSADRPFRPGASVALDCGAVACRLVPRAVDTDTAAAAA